MPSRNCAKSQKVIGGGTGLGGALTKKSILCPETAFFGPKGPRNQVKINTQRETVRTLHVRLDCLVTKCPKKSSPLTPRSFQETAQKWLMMALIARTLCQQTPKPRNNCTSGYLAQTQIPRAPSRPATPTFSGFQPSESPANTPRPPYHWSRRVLAHKKCQKKCLEKGLFGDQKWAKNTFSQKSMADHLGCTNQGNEPIFSPS